MLGILLVDKPKGITSHDAVDRIRRQFGTRRVGHAGTLDPMATGLLVVAVGPATRFLQYLPLEPKEYEGTVAFGRSSTTYDLEGELSKPMPVPQDLQVRLDAVRPKFLGVITQLPPIFSAVKVAGKPLYHYARKGQDAPREPRSVHIEELELSAVTDEKASLRVVCSGGTYIRSLAHDLGMELGCGAHLIGLRRTRAGRFCVERAVNLEDASLEHLIPLADALPPMPILKLNPTEIESIRQGRRIGVLQLPSGRLAGLMDDSGVVVGVAHIDGHELQPECVLPIEAGHG